MTPTQQRTLVSLQRQVQAFLSAVGAEDGIAVLALLSAAGERGAYVIARGHDPEVNRARLLSAVGIVEQAYRNVAVASRPQDRLIVEAPAGVM